MPDPIVIVGGGFAGVECARRLERLLARDHPIVLFSQENHLCFTPLLAEVVGGSINPAHVVWPIRQMVRRTLCRMATVTKLDLPNRKLTFRLENGDVKEQAYSQLVLAVGAVVNLDVMPGMAAHGLPLKTMGDSFALRNHVIGQLELAEAEPEREKTRHHLAFVVVGGGFSGVEAAGELFDLLTDCVPYYRSLRKEDMRVVLLQSRNHLLPEMPRALGEFAQRKMERRGIEVRLNTRAAAVTEYGVQLADGTEITAETIVCTIGTKEHPLLADAGLPLEKGRLTTEPDLRVAGQTNVWAMGDCAAVVNAADNTVSPSLAQFAVRQARQLADNLARVHAGGATLPFHYKMKGSFAAIGHHNAVGRVLGVNLSGFFAWFLWRGFYLTQMPTLARKIQIAFDWSWQIFFPRDIVQLSTTPTERLARAHFEPGQYVFRQGDLADRFYIIEKGTAGVYLDDGTSDPVATLGPGQHFGERSLIKAAARSASVKAESALDVIAINQASFQDAFKHWSVLRTGLQSDLARLEAMAEFREVAAKHPRLNATPIHQVMTTPVKTLPSGWDYATALAHCAKTGRDAYVVVDGQSKMVGLVTQTDFYKAVRELKPPTTPIAAIMKRPVLTVKASASTRDAMQLFLSHPVKRLVVVDDRDPAKAVGLVTPFEILPLLAVVG